MMGSARPFALALTALATLAPLASRAGAQQLDSSLGAGMGWRNIGPFRGGRTVAATGVPGRPGLFYMAPNNGGLWRTDDYGRTWTPLFDDQPTGSIGALAVAPSDPNVIYVGSGEGLQRPDLSVGDGIYKSTDAGRTWAHLGLREGRQIGAIVIDPRDPNRLFVAVLGHPYGPNPERGVYRSTDGGATFEKVLFEDENTGAIDIALDPADPRTVYAVLWAARQGPWEYGNAYEGKGSGLFKSTDGGSTWRRIGRGLPAPQQGLGRIGIGIAPSEPTRIYALVNASKLGGLYRSDDAGESFTRVNDNERIWGRGDDFANVRVDPKRADVVYVANTSTYRSTDAGAHFTGWRGAPGGDDYHTVWIDPDDPRVVLLAADQGTIITVNGGRTWSSWYNQSTAQMFHVITDDRFPYWVYGAQQESGSAGVASRSDYGEITFRDWHPVGVEEYGYVAPDPLHPGIIYGGKVSRYDERTGDVQNVGPVALRTGKYRFDRTAPLIFSPKDPHLLYFASQILWKTADGGRHWTEISPDLTRERPGVPATLGHLADADDASHRGVIYSIGPSPLDVNRIWVGTDDGLIHVTRDGGKHWTNVTPPEMTPWSKVTQIVASRYDTATAYASVSRFRLDDLHPYIYRTRDGGRSWTRIVSGLDSAGAVNAVREDPVKRGLLFAATEQQVYASIDDGGHWSSLRLNMPVTSVRDVVIHDGDLVAGTHGRGFWILDDISPLRQGSGTAASADAFLFAPRATYRVRRDRNTDTPLPPDEPAGRNPPDGAIIDYRLGSAPSGAVTIEIVDGAGKLVRRFSSADAPEPVDTAALRVPTYWLRPQRIPSAAAGMHRFVWDLTYPAPAAFAYDYPISAIVHDTPRVPQGALVLPGRYTVRLTVNGHRYERPLVIRMDPRITTPPAGLREQFALAMRITDAMRRSYEGAVAVRALRAKLDSAKAGASGDLAAEIERVSSRAAALEGGGGDELPPAAPSQAPGLERINGQLATLLDGVEGTDAAPTPAIALAVRGVERTLDAQLAEWTALRSGVVRALDVRLRAAGKAGLGL